MKRSVYQQILGCLTEAGRKDLVLALNEKEQIKRDEKALTERKLRIAEKDLVGLKAKGKAMQDKIDGLKKKLRSM